MNIITKADVKKFLKLVNLGLQNGRKKEMKIYTSGDTFDGIDVAEDYYCNVEFSFRVDPEFIEDMLSEDSFDDEMKELIKTIKP